MNGDTELRTGQTPPDRFEERLLSRILADYDYLTRAPAPSSPTATASHRTVRRPRVWAAIAVAAVVAAGVVALSSHLVASPHARLPAATHRSDTAFVVRRVRARLARLAVAGEGRVIERTTLHGDGGGGEPSVRNVDWAYIDPRTGVAYQRSVDSSADGTVLSIDGLVTTPIGDRLRTRVTFLSPARRSYLVLDNAPPGGTVSSAASHTELGIRSTAGQIAEALRGRQVTEQGTATVDGQPTVRLSVPPTPGLVKAGLPAQTRIMLYVNSRTYQPVEEVEVVPHVGDPAGGSDTSVSRWLPTTRSTIARTKVRVPAGYTRVPGPVRAFWTDAKPLFFIGY